MDLRTGLAMAKNHPEALRSLPIEEKARLAKAAEALLEARALALALEISSACRELRDRPRPRRRGILEILGLR